MTNILFIVSAIVILSLSRLTGESCRKNAYTLVSQLKYQPYFDWHTIEKHISPENHRRSSPIVFFLKTFEIAYTEKLNIPRFLLNAIDTDYASCKWWYKYILIEIKTTTNLPICTPLTSRNSRKPSSSLFQLYILWNHTKLHLLKHLIFRWFYR